MLRAHREPPETQRRQLLANRPLMQCDAERSLDAVLQILAPPAHHAVPHRVGTGRDRRPQARPAARVPAAGRGAEPSGLPARPDPRHCSGAPSLGASGGPSRRSLPPSRDPPPPAPAQSPASDSIRRAARESFVLPAAARSSVAVNSRRVIAIPAMPASCPSGCIDSDFARLGNPKRVRPKGRWYYNNDRPNIPFMVCRQTIAGQRGIGGITPAQKLKMAA